jgi:hypothetical protein
VGLCASRRRGTPCSAMLKGQAAEMRKSKRGESCISAGRNLHLRGSLASPKGVPLVPHPPLVDATVSLLGDEVGARTYGGPLAAARFLQTDPLSSEIQTSRCLCVWCVCWGRAGARERVPGGWAEPKRAGTSRRMWDRVGGREIAKVSQTGRQRRRKLSMLYTAACVGWRDSNSCGGYSRTRKTSGVVQM